MGPTADIVATDIPRTTKAFQIDTLGLSGTKGRRRPSHALKVYQIPLQVTDADYERSSPGPRTVVLALCPIV